MGKKPLAEPDTHRRTLERLGETPQSFVDRYLEQIESTVYPMMCDRAVAEDLVQETFVKAWRGLPSFKGRSKLSTWMCRIAMNTVYQHFHREKRSRAVDSDCHLSIASTEPSPEDTAMQDELQNEITTAIDRLSPKLRAAIVLIVMRKMDVAKAAKVEQCSPSTMYWRLHEARRQVKESMKGYFT